MSRSPVTLLAVSLIALTGSLAPAWAEPTPPIMPAIVETPLPPPVVLPAPETLPAEAPAGPLTATDAARLALRLQPSLTTAQAGLTAAQERVRQAQSALQPSVGLNAGYTSLPISPSNGGGSTGFSAGATLRQLIDDNQHSRTLVRQSDAQRQATQAGLARAQSDLVLQVKQAYYTYVQAGRLVTVNETNLRNRRSHQAQAQARVQAGVGLPIDVVRAETAVNDATLSLIQAQNAATVAQVGLAQLMGLDPRTPLQVGDTEEAAVPADDLNALLAAALQQRPEVQQARAALQASEYAVAAAKTANAPAYAGVVGLGFRGNSFPPTDTTLSLGVSVQWDAYDAGFTKSRVAEAEANRVAAQAQLQAVTLAVQADIAQSFLNVKTAEQRVATADAGSPTRRKRCGWRRAGITPAWASSWTCSTPRTPCSPRRRTASTPSPPSTRPAPPSPTR